MHLVVLLVFSWMGSSFLFSVEKYSIVLMYHSVFTQSHMEGHLVAFKFGKLCMKAAININVKVFV